jgi:hypothetical protein
MLTSSVHIACILGVGRTYDILGNTSSIGGTALLRGWDAVHRLTFTNAGQQEYTSATGRT